jgi:hypothetical protein
MNALVSAIISAMAFPAMNVALLWAFPASAAVRSYFAITVKPGELVAYRAGPTHDIGPFIVASLVNLLVYFLLFYLLWTLRDRVRRPKRSIRREPNP